MVKNNALLLIGSPKKNRSTSASLGRSLMDRLRGSGFSTREISGRPYLGSHKKDNELIEAFEWADLVVFSFPLYVDTLPAPVTAALEILKDHADSRGNLRNKRILAIVNCGFPEKEHNMYAIEVLKNFAAYFEMEWAGGFSIGMGGVIDGKSIEARGMTAPIAEAMDLICSSVIKKESVPEMAYSLIEKPLIPGKWLYTFMGNLSWKLQALKNGVFCRLRSRPFIKS